MNENNEQLDEVLIDENQPTTNERIGFGRRLGAYMLDALAVMVVGSIVGVLVGDSLVQLFFTEKAVEMQELSEQLSTSFGNRFAIIFEKTLEISAGISVTGLIHFFLEGAFGQSVGKFVLKIVNTSVDGSKASAGILWLRSLLKYGSSMLTLLGSAIGIVYLDWIATLWGLVIFVGFFFVFGDNKQTIHDMIAKTVVSRK